MLLIATLFIFIVLVFVWPLNAIIQYSRLMFQKKSASNIGCAFEMLMSAIAALSITRRLAGDPLDCTRIQSQFMELAAIILCKKQKVYWKKSNWLLMQLAIWLMSLEKKNKFVNFFINTIIIPNGKDCNVKLIFELALNLGQLSGLGYFCIWMQPSDYFIPSNDICIDKFDVFKFIITYILYSNGYVSDEQFKKIKNTTELRINIINGAKAFE
jgi:hypothetical protein